MSLIDQETVLFDDTSILGSNAVYSNIVSLGGTNTPSVHSGSCGYGAGNPKYINVSVGDAFGGGTSGTVAIRTSDSLSGTVAASNLALSSPTTLYTTAAILTSNATKRSPIFKAALFALPGVKQYVDAVFTPTGTFTSGSISASIGIGYQEINVPPMPVSN